MDPIIAIALIAISVIVGMFLGRILLGGQDAVIDGDAPKPKIREDLSDTRKELAEEKEQRRRIEDELKAIRIDLKSAKQRAHEKGQQLDSANEDLEKLKRRTRSLSSVEKAREDMIAAQEEAARLRAELAEAGRSQPSSRTQEEPPPVAAVATTSAQDDGESVAIDVHRQKLAEIKREARQEANNLRNQFNEQVSEERDTYKTEIRELQKRLRNAVTDVDRERRRAENSDKAYLILKSQLESALDRLSMHDPNLRRPDQLTKADLQPARPKKAAPQPSGEVVVAASEVAHEAEATEADEASATESSDSEAVNASAPAATSEIPADVAGQKEDSESVTTGEATAEEASDEAPAEDATAEEAPADDTKEDALAEADKKNVSVPPATAAIPDTTAEDGK